MADLSTSPMRHARIFLICCVYIVLSGALINFNKFLMHEGRFPHALQLTSLHMVMCFTLCAITYCIKPSLLEGVERSKGNRLEMLKYFVPIGVCFAIMLYGSNLAYLYCSIAFLQFMKEANVVMVFVFSWIAGLAVMNRQRFVVIMWVVAGASLCVSGDVHFVLIGFVLQALSQVAECTRAVITEKILTSKEMKLDPLSYTMFVAPVCLVVLGIAQCFTWKHDVVVDFMAWWHFLLPNALLAFCLNVCIAVLIKEASALGFVITGVVKDIFLVIFSSTLYGDTILPMQWMSFAVTISGVAFWSLMKVQPDHVLVTCFERVVGAEPLYTESPVDERTDAKNILKANGNEEGEVTEETQLLKASEGKV